MGLNQNHRRLVYNTIKSLYKAITYQRKTFVSSFGVTVVKMQALSFLYIILQLSTVYLCWLGSNLNWLSPTAHHRHKEQMFTTLQSECM